MKRTSFGVVVMLLLTATSGCGQAVRPTNRSLAECEIQDSFAALKQALARGDRDEIIRRISPESLAIFRRARDFGKDPDAIPAETLAQMEVLVGFQARWRLGAEKLQAQSPADLFEWAAQNGIVQIGGLAHLELDKVSIDGESATASMRERGVGITNALLSFSRHGGKWKLDFDKILLTAEPQLAAMREEQGMSKAELAVLMLEGMFRQPIPDLREFLLDPGLRKQVAALKGKGPAAIHDAVISELSAGRQRAAEEMLDLFVGLHTNDQRLVFAQAVCARSRFSKQKAGFLFKRAFTLDPRSAEGNCARLMLDMDQGRSIDEGFNGMRLIADENRDNPFFPWLIGIQCRDYYKRTHKSDRSDEGVRAYQRVLEIFDVGPVMVHHTFANLLSEGLDRYTEAVPHHKMAVQLEPREWTYEGLAGTLADLKRFDEATEAYAKATELAPEEPNNWYNWGCLLTKQKKWAECVEKFRKTLELNPAYYQAHVWWGTALKQQGLLPEALIHYEEAIRLNPMQPDVCEAAAQISIVLDETDKAQEFFRKKARAEQAQKSR